MTTIKKINEKFFFCYDVKLFRVLVDQYGYQYITRAINPKDNRPFSLFERDSRMDNIIINWTNTRH